MKKITNCSFCKKEIEKNFPPSLSKLKNRYCSIKCCGKHKYQKNMHTCEICGSKFHRRGKRSNRFCSNACCRTFFSGANHPNWKGGINDNGVGYIEIQKPNHPMSDNRGRILEHRYIMSEHLGRNLIPSEIVHHIDENKKNNDISNLQLTTRAEHIKIHATKK